MNPPTNVRPIKYSDWATCGELCQAAFPEDERAPEKFLSDLADERSMDSPWKPHFIAATWWGKEIVGVGGCSRSRLNWDVWEFTWCFVREDARGKGVGRLLVEQRLRRVSEEEGKLVLLTTARPEIYQKYGFRDLGTLGVKPVRLMSLEL